MSGPSAASSLRRRLIRFFTEPERPPERDPDAPRELSTLDDWILFGPRLR